MPAQIQALQQNWRSLLTEGADIATSSAPLQLSDEEWRKRLAPQAYRVLREKGTEYAGTSPLNSEHRPGIFVCAGCGLPLPAVPARDAWRDAVKRGSTHPSAD